MIEMPGGSESYYPPQLLIRPDGEKVILIGTGGTAAHSWGGLHAISLSQLAATDKVPVSPEMTSNNTCVVHLGKCFEVYSLDLNFTVPYPGHK